MYSIASDRHYFFNGEEITNFTFPDTTKVIGAHFFDGCKTLTSVTIPNSVTSIGTEAFYGCSLTLLSFINNSSLDAEANNYWGATICDERTEDGLCIKDDVVILYLGKGESVVIPNSVTSIAAYVFEGYNLKSLTIGSGLVTIGRNAFSTKPKKTIWLTNTPPSKLYKCRRCHELCGK